MTNILKTHNTYLGAYILMIVNNKKAMTNIPNHKIETHHCIAYPACRFGDRGAKKVWNGSVYMQGVCKKSRQKIFLNGNYRMHI